MGVIAVVALVALVNVIRLQYRRSHAIARGSTRA